MITFYIVYFLISLLLGITAYLVTNNVVFLIITSLVFFAYFFLTEHFYKKKQRIQRNLDNDLINFIHDFLISYVSDNDLEKAYNYTKNSVSPKLSEEMNMLDNYKVVERLDNLSNYFKNDLYNLFLTSIKNSLSLEDKTISTSFVLEESNHFALERKLINKHIYFSMCEFILLWAVSFLILITVRFAITNNFAKLSSSWFYLLGVAAYFLIFLLNLYLFNQGIKRSEKYYE